MSEWESEWENEGTGLERERAVGSLCVKVNGYQRLVPPLDDAG